MKKLGLIYLVTNIKNGKTYVGQTIHSLARRRIQHIQKSKRQIGSYFSLLHKAIRKYGIDNFVWRVLEKCTQGELNKREQFYIQQYRSYCNVGGYNLTLGGDNNFGSTGRHHYLARMPKKKKMAWLISHRLGKNNPNYGNGIAIAGRAHFLNKMILKKRANWIATHLGGDNNYQRHLTAEQRKQKCWLNKLDTKTRAKRCEQFSSALVAHNRKYGFPKSALGKKGAQCPWSKLFVLTCPDGAEYIIKSTRQAKERYPQLLPNGLACCVAGYRKQYKGFQCRHASDEDIKTIKPLII